MASVMNKGKDSREQKRMSLGGQVTISGREHPNLRPNGISSSRKCTESVSTGRARTLPYIAMMAPALIQQPRILLSNFSCAYRATDSVSSLAPCLLCMYPLLAVQRCLQGPPLITMFTSSFSALLPWLVQGLSFCDRLS